MKFGVCYYVLGCIEPYLEFVEDESLECVIHRVKTNDFTGVRFARTGLDEVPYINICDESGYCLYRIPVTELQYNSFGYILDNYGDDDSLDVNTAEQGEPVDVEITSASEQGNTVEKTSKKSKLGYLAFPLCIFALFFFDYVYFASHSIYYHLNEKAFSGGMLFAFSLACCVRLFFYVCDSFLNWFIQLKAVENIINRLPHYRKGGRKKSC